MQVSLKRSSHHAVQWSRLFRQCLFLCRTILHLPFFLFSGFASMASLPDIGYVCCGINWGGEKEAKALGAFIISIGLIDAMFVNDQHAYIYATLICWVNVDRLAFLFYSLQDNKNRFDLYVWHEFDNVLRSTTGEKKKKKRQVTS